MRGKESSRKGKLRREKRSDIVDEIISKAENRGNLEPVGLDLFIACMVWALRFGFGLDKKTDRF